MTVDDVLAAWDRQQEAYVPHREQRFAVLADVLAGAVDGLTQVVDLGCGPGSLSLRLAERFPELRVLALDVDPVMVRLAERVLADYRDRVEVVQADLADRSWVSAVGRLNPQAIVSTTALHWLTPAELVLLYRRAFDLLPSGGVLLNGDHMEFSAAHPTMAALAQRYGTTVEEEAFDAGVPTWDQWWELVAATPELTRAKAVRDQRFADDSEVQPMAVQFHLTALRQAGFNEVATVWQLFDDYVVIGRR